MDQTFLPIPEFDLDAMVERACDLLRLHQPKDQPYYGCFSGGKDSVVIKELTRLAGVNVVWHYNVTTIDPPELVRFIKREHPDVVWDRSRHGNFFNRLVKKGFPTRRARWCCDDYKESASPKGSVLIMGVRAAESNNRALMWKHVTFHRRTRAWCVSPILDWRSGHVWNFIRGRGIQYCELYDEGFTRLGCIGCPMAGRAGKFAQFARWPGYERQWRRAFQRLWDRRRADQPKQTNGKEWIGTARFRSCEHMWQWWLSDDPLPGEDQCQLPLMWT